MTNYSAWARPAAFEAGPRASNSPHGAAVMVYINAVVVKALANEDGLGLTAWPEDATIVVEGYGRGDALSADRRSVCRSATAAGTGSSIRPTTSSGRASRGGPDICLGCHSGGQDFVRSFGLPKPVVEE